MELHPHFQQPELFRFVVDNGIQPIGYCPLGSPGRPERDRTPEDTSPAGGSGHRRHRRDGMAFTRRPSASNGRCSAARRRSRSRSIPRNYAANLAAAAEDPLTDDEMKAIAGIDRNCRLIKGQVFLWKDGQSWEDLWDVNGDITPP